MSQTRGEGRSPAERSQGVIVPAAVRRAEADARKAEEAAWAARSSPVETRVATCTQTEERRTGTWSCTAPPHPEQPDAHYFECTRPSVGIEVRPG